METKCVWCNKGGELIPFHFVKKSPTGSESQETFAAHPAHVAAAREFIERVDRYSKRFLILVFSLVGAATVAGVFLSLVPRAWQVALIGLLTAALGATIAKYPFATPETVRALGLRRSAAVVRGTGIAILCIGAGLTLLGAFGIP